MAELTKASSNASSSGSSNYEVFLNFRGEDTRNNFTGFLYKALKNSGVNVFLDSENLRTGDDIGPALISAIKGSKISIPVFSKGYASSRWCLLELSHIYDCHISNSQMVLPIFLDIEPSHVRYQIGSFEEPFQKHEKKIEPHMVKSWREALRVVGNLKGWVLKEDVDGDQAKLVEVVKQRVLDELSSRTQLAESKFLIGIDSRVKDLIDLLNNDSNDVQFVGICGLGGIGKTTIAKAVYNRILPTFDNKHSFLLDVREQATQLGLVSLQKRLLKDIFKTDFDIGHYEQGKKMIEERLGVQKVLLVLDDVDHQEQIAALAGELNWFGPRSRVIITTRNERILNVAKVDEDKIYKPQLLNHMESLQLFSWHAFSMNQPDEDYKQLSHDVVWYSGRLPLTLEVLGSYLSGINNKKVWESALQKLKEIPHERIQKRLKISYDNLEDDYQKAIFLDAACFFIGWKEETLISIWKACGYPAESAIYTLIKRSLLKFEGSYLKMHDQVRDMGRTIVSEENFLEPGKHSRIWSRDQILEVLEEHKETDMIKGMILPSDLLGIDLDKRHFEKMSNVRFLDISSANFIGEFSCLPSALRWLRWMNCPWDNLPTNFYHKRLVYLNLSESNIEQAWNIMPRDNNKKFQKLQVLDLSHCKYLSNSPDFSWFPYLERLDLTSCHSLEKLDKSIGDLKSLKELILSGCGSLKEVPDGVGRLEKLEVLVAKHCKELVKLPRSMVRMRCLHIIDLEGSINMSKFPHDFSKIPNLRELNVSQNHYGYYDSRPVSIELPELPSSLVELNCLGHKSLVALPDLSLLKNLRTLYLPGCQNLKAIRGFEGTRSLEALNADGCHNMTRTSRKILGQGELLPNVSRQDRYSLTANDVIYNKGLILCIVWKFTDDYLDYMNLTPGWLHTIDLHISALIYGKDGPTRCHHTFRIKDIKLTADRDTIYMHHFEGFDWFGIPLQGKDAIEILYIDTHTYTYGVNFWKVLFDNGEHSSAMMVADIFDWSFVNDDNDLVPSLTVLKCWSPAEGEGSNSVPKELEEEGVLATDDEDGDGESSCVAVIIDDGSNQQTLDQPSHVQEKGILLTMVDQIIEWFGTGLCFRWWKMEGEEDETVGSELCNCFVRMKAVWDCFCKLFQYRVFMMR